MGASFRNIGQIQALAGCDLLTISPDLLKELQSHPSTFEAALLKETASLSDAQMISLDQETFHTQLKANAMASQKLEEGISSFCADAIKIEDLLKSHNA
jgi:transaldolase